MWLQSGIHQSLITPPHVIMLGACGDSYAREGILLYEGTTYPSPYWKELPMGSAEVTALSEDRASNPWVSLGEPLLSRFDHWLDGLQEQLPEPASA